MQEKSYKDLTSEEELEETEKSIYLHSSEIAAKAAI